MSADLNIHDGKVSFVGAVKPAWHGTGTILPRQFTSQEALEYANLDFEVAKGEAFVKYAGNDVINNVKGVNVENTFFTYRKDNGVPLCSNGKAVTGQYEIVQNREAFKFFDDIVGVGEAFYETAGALKKGEIIFITAQLPDIYKIGNDDIVNYLLLRLSHDGSSSVQIMFTPVRVVCANTLAQALRQNRNIATLRHSQSVHTKLEIASSMIKATKEMTKDLIVLGNQMLEYKLDDKEELFMIAELFLTPEELGELKMIANPFTLESKTLELSTRKKNIIRDLARTLHIGVGQEGIEGTLWGYVNGVTTYFQNYKSYSTDEKKMTTIMDGHASKISANAFSAAKRLLEIKNN